jgi:hypothetical protein
MTIRKIAELREHHKQMPNQEFAYDAIQSIESITDKFKNESPHNMNYNTKRHFSQAYNRHHNNNKCADSEQDIRIHPKNEHHNTDKYVWREEFNSLKREIRHLREEVKQLKNGINPENFIQTSLERPVTADTRLFAERPRPKAPPPRGDHHGWRPHGERRTLNIG